MSATVQANTPCLVGAAQFVGREEDPARALSPADMLARVAADALADAARSSAEPLVAAAALARQIDTLAAIRLFADSGAGAFASPFGTYENLPWSVAQRLSADPAHLIYGPVGGNTPQMLINMLAERIWRGEAEMCLLVGGEALRTQARAAKAGLTLDWGEAAPAPPEQPVDDVRMLSGHEAKHGLALPVNVYPLFETAFGAARGWDPDTHVQRIGALMAPFSEVAAENPYAQVREARTAAELVTPSADNRWIAWPYTKYLVSNLFVDQAGAVLMMSSAKADELGIPDAGRVYLHGSADTHEKLLPVDRPDYARCPAIRIGAAHALAQAGIGANDLNIVDLYSCFPVAVELAAQEIGLSTDDPARLTQTGGLPYFGGAGNAYSMHGIAEIFAKCRAAPDRWGFVFANGGYLTKHSFGVYSGRPGYGERAEPASYQAEIDAMPSPALAEAPLGAGVIEAYTVVHDRGGARFAIIIGGLGENGGGDRFLANMTEGLGALMQANAVGRRITVSAGDKINRAVLA
ncbi:acetyl-CoA acetyltransferase [Pacificimonas flava]|uniref:Acetyl-CoA acetyltransferase n=1 Tax=Pacificimonas flava TaxID=1234595 RepID=M2TKD8_9SPHN|nr:acetyl-CoA acetyltransferase [Pacificimonas flava]EMD82146.1 acetyl-CoA acetyltransferase [Pacificimonas flava]MBB5280374.1 acetyl-CoA C-acetyltransferase [Pacificimonas flava]